MDRIEAKEKELLVLKVKYAHVKTLLESHGVTTSGLSRDTSTIGANGSGSHRVSSSIDIAISDGNVQP